MSINREGPTQSSIAKHFLGLWVLIKIGGDYLHEFNIELLPWCKGIVYFCFSCPIIPGKKEFVPDFHAYNYFPNDFPLPFDQFSWGVNGKRLFFWSSHVGWAKQAAFRAFASSTPCDMEKQRGEAYDHLA